MVKPGKGRSTRKAWRWLGPVLVLTVAGCATGRPHVDQALLANKGARSPGGRTAESYVAACPDVLEIVVARRPELTGQDPIDPCGCIRLGSVGMVRVEGLPVTAMARRVAAAAGVSSADVQVRVAEFKSQQIYLFGQVSGLQRAVAYQGPETVLDVLERVGGITAGAAPGDVDVIRSHVADGHQAEVFHVDLRAIVTDRDARANLRLQPSDQVYVGESRRSSLEKCVPPCLRPVYELLCGLRGTTGAAPGNVHAEDRPGGPPAPPSSPSVLPPAFPDLRPDPQ
jgi:protein involved in polysaccharide export with SLBB domain